jgi:hypothetical protein
VQMIVLCLSKVKAATGLVLTVQDFIVNFYLIVYHVLVHGCGLNCDEVAR